MGLGSCPCLWIESSLLKDIGLILNAAGQLLLTSGFEWKNPRWDIEQYTINQIRLHVCVSERERERERGGGLKEYQFL